MDGKKLIDIAFREASKTAAAMKHSGKIKKERRHVEADLQRARTVHSVVVGNLKACVLKSRPKLTEFERALLATSIDFAKIEDERKRSVSSLQIIDRIWRELEMKIKYARNKDESNHLRQAFYGRLASILKRLDLTEMEKIERAMVELPRLADVKTAIICGAPNVGKSMLLKQLTGHKVKIASYPFTTQEILVGFMKVGHEAIQLIDTPGLLDRPFEKHNIVERRAVLALRYLSKNFIFVLDPSETCGFQMDYQLRLMEAVKTEFNPKMLVVASKKDLPHVETKADIAVDANDEKDVAALKELIWNRFK
jgi:nucleolar GTP-binding protein